MTTGGVHGENPKKSRVKLVHLNKSKELPKTWKRNFRISKLIDQHYFNVFDEKLRCQCKAFFPVAGTNKPIPAHQEQTPLKK